MTTPNPPSSPDSAPVERRKIHAAHFLRVHGRGRAEIELKGTGQLTMLRGRYDDFCFEGRGLPRHLSATCVHLRGASGRVILEGEEIELEFFGGICSALLVGTFEVETRSAAGPAPTPQARAAGGQAAPPATPEAGRPAQHAPEKRSVKPWRRV
jgi:hypothetical protein